MEGELPAIKPRVLETKDPMYARDVFISHASADKTTHARPLNEALRRRGVSTWLDEAQINDGDNFVQSIAWGLDRAVVVVFLITEHFIGRPWAEKELTTALSKEISTGTTRVVAILDVANPELVLQRFPLPRDKLYVLWPVGVDEIATRLGRRFARHPDNWHILHHPADYVGEIWTRIVPESLSPHSHVYKLTLLWGPYRFTTEVQPLSDGPISLVHHKLEPDNLPLYAQVEPAAIVTAGQGPPPDPDQINR
jgi:hypothetical protein